MGAAYGDGYDFARVSLDRRDFHGVLLCLFAGLYWLLDVLALAGVRAFFSPMRVFGTNALLAFGFSTILTAYVEGVRVGAEHIKAKAWLYNHAFAPWLQPFHASLGYALAVVALNRLLVSPFYRKRVFLRL